MACFCRRAPGASGGLRGVVRLLGIRPGLYLPACGNQQLAHVGTPDAEATGADAGDDFELAPALRHAPLAQRGQVLDARHFVARCAVVSGQLGFNDHLRIEFARDD
jgi:hypothetical protein